MKHKFGSKTKMLIIVGVIVILGILAVSVIYTVGKNPGNKLNQQLELGKRYLSELDYENAIAAYEAAIQIDLKNEDAYLGLADVYVAMGNFEKAQEVLAEGYEQTESRGIASRQEEIVEGFAASDIHLTMEVVDGCVAYLEWNKVDCVFYEIQMMDGDVGVWKTVKTVSVEDECTYTSPRLSPGTGYSFRVAAVLEDYAAVSEVCECEMEVTPLYCTVWPVKDLNAYSDAAKSNVVGEVKTLVAYCVVDVQDDMFGVNVNGSVCYIDSNYCMINLPEYLGALCSYDITNSYFSIFMAHDFQIPGLTGEVIKGFENVWLTDNSFLVPLLYPTAIKLETAIENAREKGYRLKIYESFRPHEASVYTYKTALKSQYATLPESTYWGDDPGANLYVQETEENGMQTVRRKTYGELMIGNTNFTMSNFVSAGISKHNLGVALDLTLEYMETGAELTMQTDMHDLSQYSARVQNNSNAKMLSEIMTSSGFNVTPSEVWYFQDDEISEWWHFQDDETNNKLSLPSVYNGVTAECWMSNGFEWRYRYADGFYAVDGRHPNIEDAEFLEEQEPENQEGEVVENVPDEEAFQMEQTFTPTPTPTTTPMYRFGMQMTIMADEEMVNTLQAAGLDLSNLIDDNGYKWYTNGHYFHCDTFEIVTYETIENITNMEFWEFQYSDLASQLYPYDYGYTITVGSYTLGTIIIRGYDISGEG